MDCNTLESAIIFLQTLVGQPLRYGLKSPDTDLYDFGFGELINTIDCYGAKRTRCTHSLHVLCRFKVIWRNGEDRVDKYYEDTPCERFRGGVQRLMGLRIQAVTLSSKNDLWMDLGDCWIVFATFENGEESWRYFTSNAEDPHLVASDVCLEFVGECG